MAEADADADAVPLLSPAPAPSPPPLPLSGTAPPPPPRSGPFRRGSPGAASGPNLSGATPPPPLSPASLSASALSPTSPAPLRLRPPPLDGWGVDGGGAAGVDCGAVEAAGARRLRRRRGRHGARRARWRGPRRGEAALVPRSSGKSTPRSKPPFCAAAMATFSEAPAGDAAAGEKIFRTKCAYCHSVDKGAGHKHGPNLNGLFGRQAGTAPGFSYPSGDKIVAVVWEENNLYDYLLNPKKYTPAKMGFNGLKQPQDRADLIAYLKKATV